jgi:hypothetical protein
MQDDFVVAIRLKGVKPRVSRRVQLSPNLGLHRFHQLIQVVMGWEDATPHLWYGPNDDFGDPRQFVPPGPTDERRAKAVDLFSAHGDTAVYMYDFEAQWTHELLLEDFAAPAPFPVLIDGTGACPPDGIEGPYFYEQFKIALKDRSHPLWSVDADLIHSFRGFNPKHFSQQDAVDRLGQLTSSWQKKKTRRKPAIRSRSLMLIDNQPIRQRYWQELNEARAELHKLQTELDRFKGDDTNAFKRWLHVTFPVRLSRIRELHEEMARLANRLNLVSAFQKHGVKAPGAAYQRAIRVETGEDPMPDFPPPSAHERRALERERELESEEEREFWRGTMRSLGAEMGLASIDDDELDEMCEEMSREEPGSGLRECQSIYRQIALRLHPDRGGSMSESEAQIWYRAQEAYADRDFLTLRQLWSRISDQNHNGAELSCSDIITSILETQTQITALQVLRESLKREPEWNFCRLSNRQLQSRKVRVEKDLIEQEGFLLKELQNLRDECQRLAELQQRWESKRQGAAEQINLF